MSDEKRKTGFKEDKTGRLPRFENLPSAKAEPPQPTTLPEFPEGDGSSITGMIKLLPVEGEDDAKHADDRASHTQGGESPQPKPQQ